ncbi:MAG TPA: bifunctional 3-(3-hydroxy-phenyl)propionate/3-hydroxycinnamic acid hydroxylase [Novosphingobium sp.]|nr:bifunctional 3-(3-hydroxy-phenyl)propionate/3-hydroxycinnamic acid hydroxylase [Novosphingobium sp.]
MKDVVIVGAGPVGMFTALQLAQRGLTVDLYERWGTLYPRPRACGVDHECIRQLQGLGLIDELTPLLEPVIGPDMTYQFKDTEFETLLQIDWNRPGASGWAQVNQFYQPDFERVLLRQLQASPNVTVHYDRELASLEQHDDHVTLDFIEPDNPAARFRAEASYVIGADGARSTVRDLLGLNYIDLGFAYDWLVVDVIPHEQREWKPYVMQYLNPERPTTLVGSGPGRRRWEFMRLPGETIDQLNTAEAAWELLVRWDITPENATLERHTVYTFRGSWVDQWKQGRVMLAGDAAHLMPPFLAQGLCAGMRDGLALAWRLGAVLGEGASEDLLESYGPERREHVVEIIRQAVDIGRIICMIDPAEVADRDARMKAAMKDPALGLKPPPEPRLGYAGGYRHEDSGSGYLSVQGRVRRGIEEGLFDDVVGKGWQLLLRGATGRVSLDRATRDFLGQIDAAVADFGPDGDTTDLDGTYNDWFDRLGVDAILVRPDLYVFGSSPIAGAGDLVAAAQRVMALPAREPAMVNQAG